MKVGIDDTVDVGDDLRQRRHWLGWAIVPLFVVAVVYILAVIVDSVIILSPILLRDGTVNVPDRGRIELARDVYSDQTMDVHARIISDGGQVLMDWQVVGWTSASTQRRFYTATLSDDKAVVAVFETSAPQTVILLYDYESGVRWPTRDDDYPFASHAETGYRLLERFDPSANLQLSRDNPYARVFMW